MATYREAMTLIPTTSRPAANLSSKYRRSRYKATVCHNDIIGEVIQKQQRRHPHVPKMDALQTSVVPPVHKH